MSSSKRENLTEACSSILLLEQQLIAATLPKVSMLNDELQRHWVGVLLRKYLLCYIRDYQTFGAAGTHTAVTRMIKVLEKKWNCLKKNETGGSNDRHEGNGDEEMGNSPFVIEDLCEDENERKLKDLVIVKDYKIEEETAIGDDRIDYLCKILSIAVVYQMYPNEEHSIRWIVKVPSDHFVERHFARRVDAYQREVLFYSDMARTMKLWLLINQNQMRNCCSDGSDEEEGSTFEDFDLNIPHCYYAVGNKEVKNTFNCESQFPSAECTLILEDLRGKGYGKRHFSVGLTCDEAVMAIWEISKVHAISWMMREHGVKEAMHWPEVLKSEEMNKLHLEKIYEGFQRIKALRQSLETSSVRKQLLRSLLQLEPYLSKIFKGLLKPLQEPAVSALIHMDFWSDNLLFRKNENETGAGQGMSDGEEEDEKASVDCFILDWQMVGWGRITHDVAILLVTSLDSDTRRENCDEFLKLYCTCFANVLDKFDMKMPFGLADFTKQFWESALFAVLLTVGRLDLVVSEQSTTDRFFDILYDLKLKDLI